MFHKRYHRQVPELNTTSTADISFMLLIFFLVTSSMDTDKGLQRQMAPPQVKEELSDINKELVLQVALDANDSLTLDGKSVSLGQLSDAIVSLASIHRTEHVVAVQADSATTYEAYFRMQDAIVRAYQRLRQQYALSHFGCDYASLNGEQRTEVNTYYPQRISENPVQEGGRP